MSCVCLTGSKLLRCYRTTKPAAKALPEQGTRPVLADVRRDMIRLRRVLMIDGSRKVVALFTDLFERQLEAVIDEGTRRLSRKDTSIEITLGGSEAVWAAVLEEVLGPNAVIEVVPDYMPIAQSVIARAYDNTCSILGEAQAHDASIETQRRARLLANKVTRINETTKVRMQNVISESVAGGDSTSGVARALRDAFPDIALKRLPTIARTEVGNMLDEGVKQAVRESSVVKTMDVWGCKSREPNSPQYMGQSTCNIVGVPVHDVDKLEFHINHTGAIIAGSFW